MRLKVREMILALLSESDLVFSDDIIEVIIDKVSFLSDLFFFSLFLCTYLLEPLHELNLYILEHDMSKSGY